MAKSISPERRASTRFALALEVRYVASDRRAPVEMGSGRTIDLSSSGLSFTADRPLPTGQRLGLVILLLYRAALICPIGNAWVVPPLCVTFPERVRNR
jgi:hypothetical protein